MDKYDTKPIKKTVYGSNIEKKKFKNQHLLDSAAQ